MEFGDFDPGPGLSNNPTCIRGGPGRFLSLTRVRKSGITGSTIQLFGLDHFVIDDIDLSRADFSVANASSTPGTVNMKDRPTNGTIRRVMSVNRPHSSSQRPGVALMMQAGGGKTEVEYCAVVSPDIDTPLMLNYANLGSSPTFAPVFFTRDTFFGQLRRSGDVNGARVTDTWHSNVVVTLREPPIRLSPAQNAYRQPRRCAEGQCHRPVDRAACG